MRLRPLLTAVLVLVVVGGGWTAATAVSAGLTATGPSSVEGTEATGVFSLAGRTIREIRYADQQVVSYRFTVRNSAITPITVTGMRAPRVGARLLHLESVTDAGGEESFTVPGHGTREVVVRYRMGGCETLSARAGSFATHVDLDTERLGGLERVTRVQFPEELHTGSPREARCPGAGADTRPNG